MCLGWEGRTTSWALLIQWLAPCVWSCQWLCLLFMPNSNSQMMMCSDASKKKRKERNCGRKKGRKWFIKIEPNFEKHEKSSSMLSCCINLISFNFRSFISFFLIRNCLFIKNFNNRICIRLQEKLNYANVQRAKIFNQCDIHQNLKIQLVIR